ncbi:MAG: amidohydrolase family protein [Clostridia bacterium]|nr:amidohydrolase family protein [Clostridia bacterium]
MAKYLEIPFPTVKNPFDGHIHIHKWRDTQSGETYIHGLEEYRRACGLKYIALASLPSGNPIPAPRDVSNNIMCAFYKLANENTYAYGGFIYPSYPAKEEEMENMSLITQLDELNEIGFDGIKMLEGKPNLYARVGKELDSDFFDCAFEKMEKEGTYVLMHAADPRSFWENATEEGIEKGWFYGDASKFPTNESIYNQVESILKKHPKLNLCLAHFFFLSESPEKLEELFEKYESLAVDITPGGEMYHGFNKRREYFKSFFEKYQNRIFFGTDMDYTPHLEAGIWLCDRVYRYLAEDTMLMSFDDTELQGLGLSQCAIQNIFSDNLVGRLGDTPKPINKEALRRYIEKYRHLIEDKELDIYIDELIKEYLD